MYTILVTDGHELIATVRERIMQRSKLVNKLHFLVKPNYDNLDMAAITVCMEYLTPVGHEYKSEILVKSDELYDGYLEFVVPMDTALTKEAGELEVQLSFITISMDADGKATQYVRKTSPTKITIVPISAWSDIIPDETLTAVDQRLLVVQSMISQIEDMNMAIAEGIPDGLVAEDGKVYLGQNGTRMPDSDGVDVVMPRTPDDDGKDDGFIELESFVADGGKDDEDGNFTELE